MTEGGGEVKKSKFVTSLVNVVRYGDSLTTWWLTGWFVKDCNNMNALIN